MNNSSIQTVNQIDQTYEYGILGIYCMNLFQCEQLIFDYDLFTHP